jgi:uncharacterized protein YjiS (DUF1127 family)
MLTFLGNSLRAVTAALADWQEWRRAYDELAALDDRSLADIGISRSEIPYVLSHATAHAPATPEAAANGNFQHAA